MINDLRPGRDTDRLVAVPLGWTFQEGVTGYGYRPGATPGCSTLPYFSTDLTDAIRALEEWQAKQGASVVIEIRPEDGKERYWIGLCGGNRFSACAPTLPMAICRLICACDWGEK
jgi:hypothetical protein